MGGKHALAGKLLPFHHLPGKRARDPHARRLRPRRRKCRASLPGESFWRKTDIVNQRVAVRMLEQDGHHVTVAHNGKEAVAAWLAQPFDLILMDMQMPEMDGAEAVAEIRRSENGSHIPIVAVTAHAMAGDRERCLAAGMDDYLAKPIDKAALLKIVAQLDAAR